MTKAWTPIAVEFAPGALNTIRTQVAHVVSPHSKDGQEAGGLLCGAIVEFATVSLVRIDRVIPIADRQHFSEAMAECSSDAIGWYRTERSVKDAGADTERSAGSDDRAWSGELFPARQSAFLICFPEEDLSLPGTLYIWTAGADEVTTGVSLGRHSVPADKPSRPREPARASAVAASGVSASAAGTERRDPAPAVGSPMWSWNALVLVLATGIVGAGAFFLVRGRTGTVSERPAETRSDGIAMTLQRAGSELQVNWNPHAPKVTQATGGSLIIAEDDGESPSGLKARNVTLKLSPQQLESGHLVYRTEAEDIRMEMEIVGPSGTYVESVRVAGGLPGLPARPAVSAAAAPVPPARNVVAPVGKPVATPAITPVIAPLAPEKKPAENIQETPRTFVPPPQVTTAGSAVAARPVAPPPDAPQLAGPANAPASGPAAGLPAVNLPVPKPPQNVVPANTLQAGASQAGAAKAKVEEYIGPRAIHSVQPAFDASANRTIDNAFSQSHEAHEVQVEVTIDEHGKVTKVSKGSTTGPFAYLFVDAALAAARRWQFEPASMGGRPVASKMTLKFAFVRNH